MQRYFYQSSKKKSGKSGSTTTPYIFLSGSARIIRKYRE